MTTLIEKLDTMFGVWNTTDQDEQEQLANAALESNVHFVDPNHNIIGREPFLAMVRETQTKYPGLRYGRSCEPDWQNNFCRYHWAIHKDDQPVMTGFDVTEVNDAGKVVKVIGFFGELARNAAA